MNHKNRSALALALLLGVAACGGSGGGSGGGGASPEPAPAAPLVLLGSTPADGATGVAREVQPAASFDQSLDAASANGGSVQLLSAIGVPIAANVGTSGAGLTVKPLAGALPGGTTYRLRLGADLKSVAGGALGSALVSSFTTVAQQWSGPSQASAAAAENTSGFALATNAAGNATIVWTEIHGGMRTIMARHYRNGNWSAGEPVAPPVADQSQIGSAAMDAEGNVIVVWTRFDAGSGHVHAGQYNATDGSWLAGEIGEMTGGANWTDAQIVMDAGGNATVAWRQQNGIRTMVNTRRYDKQFSTWGVHQRVDLDGASQVEEAPALAVDGAGIVTIAWTEDSGGKKIVNASRYDNALWSAPQRLNDIAVTDAALPSLAVDRAGNVMAVWHQSTGPDTAISASRYANGNWSAPQTIGKAIQPQRAAVVADPAGNVTAAWVQHTGAYYGVRASRYGNGAWSTPVMVAGANLDAFAPELSVDIAGNVTAIWGEEKGITRKIVSNRYLDGLWSATPVTHASSTNQAAFTRWRTVTDGNGTVTIAWDQQTNPIPLPYTFTVNVDRLH